MNSVRLPPTLASRGYYAFTFSKDDMLLVSSALAHVSALSTYMLQGSDSEHALLASIVDDWHNEWSRRINRAVRVSSDDVLDLMLVGGPAISLTLDLRNRDYYLICKGRYIDQLRIILDAGREWLANDSSRIVIAQLRAFQVSKKNFSSADLHHADVTAEIQAIGERYDHFRNELL